LPLRVAEHLGPGELAGTEHLPLAGAERGAAIAVVAGRGPGVANRAAERRRIAVIAGDGGARRASAGTAVGRRQHGDALAEAGAIRVAHLLAGMAGAC